MEPCGAAEGQSFEIARQRSIRETPADDQIAVLKRLNYRGNNVSNINENTVSIFSMYCGTLPYQCVICDAEESIGIGGWRRVTLGIVMNIRADDIYSFSKSFSSDSPTRSLSTVVYSVFSPGFSMCSA